MVPSNPPLVAYLLPFFEVISLDIRTFGFIYEQSQEGLRVLFREGEKLTQSVNISALIFICH